MKRMKFVAIFSLCFCVVACEGSDASDDSMAKEEANSIETNEVVETLPAGEVAVDLGVQRWDVVSSTTIRGINDDGDIVAEFHIDGENHAIRSIVPEAGERTMAGDDTVNTMSALTEEYLDAFEADLMNASEGALELGIDDDVVDKYLWSCYNSYWSCWNDGYFMLVRGWIRGFSCEFPLSACWGKYGLII